MYFYVFYLFFGLWALLNFFLDVFVQDSYNPVFVNFPRNFPYWFGINGYRSESVWSVYVLYCCVSCGDWGSFYFLEYWMALKCMKCLKGNWNGYQWILDIGCLFYKDHVNISFFGKRFRFYYLIGCLSFGRIRFIENRISKVQVHKLFINLHVLLNYSMNFLQQSELFIIANIQLLPRKTVERSQK